MQLLQRLDRRCLRERSVAVAALIPPHRQVYRWKEDSLVLQAESRFSHFCMDIIGNMYKQRRESKFKFCLTVGLFPLMMRLCVRKHLYYIMQPDQIVAIHFGQGPRSSGQLECVEVIIPPSLCRASSVT